MLQIETNAILSFPRDSFARAAEPRPVVRTALEAAASDSVQLSEAAERAAADQPALREELVRRIRAEIEAGVYLTPQKLDIAAEQLHDTLRGR